MIFNPYNGQFFIDAGKEDYTEQLSNATKFATEDEAAHYVKNHEEIVIVSAIYEYNILNHKGQ